MSKYLKLDDLIKELQEIQKKHGNLDVFLGNTHRKKYYLFRDFEVRTENGFTGYEERDYENEEQENKLQYANKQFVVKIGLD